MAITLEDRKHLIDFVSSASEILSNQRYAALHDSEYPLPSDLVDLAAARISIIKSESIIAPTEPVVSIPVKEVEKAQMLAENIISYLNVFKPEWQEGEGMLNYDAEQFLQSIQSYLNKTATSK